MSVTIRSFRLPAGAAAALLCAATAAPATGQETRGEPAPAIAEERTSVQEPPRASAVPVELESHGHVRVDPYYWLRERDKPEVIAYLEAENAYLEAELAHTRDLQEAIFGEIRERTKETDASVPYRERGHYYYRRTEEGKDYPIHARRAGSLDAPEQVMLDVNELAEGHGYYAAAGLRVSADERILAFGEDTVGRRIYTIRFRDLETGESLPDRIPGTSGNLAWAEDGRTLFYTVRDPGTLRAFRVYRHLLGTDPSEDELVFEEVDEAFSVRVWKTRSRAYVMIGSHQTVSDEYRFVDARRPGGEFRLLLPRERGHEHRVDHLGDHFYLRTNDGAENFRLVRAPVDDPRRERWEELIGAREQVLLEDFELFRDHLVALERAGGLRRIRIRRWSDGPEHEVAFEEPAYRVVLGDNPEIGTGTLRFEYESMATPPSVYDYDMETRERTLLKREEVLGTFDPADYATGRLMAPARDGARVPVSIVYRRDTPLEGRSPLLLYGYGSYGATLDPTFSIPRLSLLDRGFVYAVAHVRGGQELGRAWYEDGKLFNKMNTFYDFIDAAEHLVERGFTDPERLFAMGGSAGGLLIGAVVNLRPDLWRGVVAHVPFVDVVTTMLDETIPLTTFEYDEWGNPDDPEAYRYILSYSPYDNVEAKDYPHMLVTTGLHDSQVQYWEPAKWTAKLRATKTDDNLLLLRTNLEAGHGGASGRYRRWREIALDYAFLIDLAGAGEASSAEAPSRETVEGGAASGG